MGIKDHQGTLVFFVNGKKVVDDQVDPEWTLLYYLRSKLRLTGTKLGCAEGGCGACTVMISKKDRKKNETIHLAVNACLTPVCAVHGAAVTTVEGIGSVETKLHPVQERIAKAHGSQCGFCTPGIVMSMYSLLRSLPGKPNMKDLEVAFQGNLCRCTGYRPIIEGYKTFTEEYEQMQRAAVNGTCGLGENCCKNKKLLTNGSCSNGTKSEIANGSDGPMKLFDSSSFIPYDPTQEPIFPPELAVSDELDRQFINIKGPKVTWYRPVTLEQLLDLKKSFPSAKIVNGNTEIGVEVKFKNFLYPVLIMPNQIKELTEVSVEEDKIKVGAAVTLSEMEKALLQQMKTVPSEKTRIFEAITDMLHWFAGKQIRNTGTVGGNIMTGSPISDLNPIFMAGGCELELISKDNGRRTVPMDHNFWTGYRRNIVKEDEILLAIFIPFTEKNQYFKAYKQAKRRDDDIAIVNAAFNVTLNGNKITNINISYGGMAPTTILTKKTASLLIGKEWNESMLNEAYESLMLELPLSPEAPGGMISYRRSLTLSLFFKFYLYLSQILEENGFSNKLPTNYLSGKDQFHSLIPQSSQYFTKVPSEQKKSDMVGRPMVHKSAFKQATGEAIYCDDIPKFENECFLNFVLSTRPHAKVVSVDATEALALPGVISFISAKDIPPEHNLFGPIFHDEEIFASEKVVTNGQAIGAIIADDPLTARRASKLVKIEYEDLEPVIISIEDAIREGSFFNKVPKLLKKGNVEEAFETAENIIEGEVRVGGQEHFYLETQACIAVPKYEDDEMELYCSTQNPTEIQHLVGHTLGIPSNRIVCKVKRMGGGFGGKESRAPLLALPVAIAAKKLKRPVRAMLDRDEDMVTTGQRHPFLGKYKVAFTKEGKLIGCEMKLYNNGGCSIDLSTSILDRAMFHFVNSYYIPNVACYGYSCKTNLSSNTAFRGFGGPQGMFIGETMMTHIAETLGKDVDAVREINLYKEGDLTHFNQELTYCNVRRCWEQCYEDFSYKARKEEAEKFNRCNRWRKRGIAIVPTMFGISFTTLFLNQGAALVLVYTDGSVLLSHGGTEMGQGLHTKMIQVASRALGINDSYFHISETSTDKVPNTSPTAASAGSDLNGMAVLAACDIINERLKPIKEANPKGSWEDWVKSAYFARISLAASGFYKTPDIGYDMSKNSGMVFNYFTFGAACAEVEIDCLTGDHQVLKSEIVMDLGESLNPAIDIGQIEGAFVQGYGLFTLEESIYSPKGVLYSRGPGMYKIPGFADIPAEFNVSLLKGAPNPRAIYSSKAVGEPPLFLSSSVFFAIRDAIKAARSESGLEGYFRLDSPATAAKIRMACVDEITNKFPEPKHKYVPWNVTV
ncbi:unnamed protein product [Nezara viridula]|uniref:xanthine dehydrogenase n=1 Tax=Nezara viridula TaxID=85310 RepID=A0A9P0MWG2_NEZVI|nr:unnamed protein product [Nezara viridula]